MANGRARLSVHRSSKNISVQLIDDVNGVTLGRSFDPRKGSGRGGQEQRRSGDQDRCGDCRAGEKGGIETCYFDRGGFLFHGKIKALAEAAREGGLKF